MTAKGLTSSDVIAMRGFDASLPMALLQAREATMRLFRPLLSTHDLTEQQWRVLRALSAAREPLATTEVAEQTFLLAPSLTRIVAKLADAGLVGRTVSTEDQRRINLSLTEAGLALVQEVAPESEAMYNHIESNFGKDRLHALLIELADLASLRAPEEALRKTSERPAAKEGR